MPKPAPNAVDFLRSLNLEDIREQIALKESELEALVGERRKEIDALRVLEKAADVAVNGKPARVPKGGAKKSSVTSSRASASNGTADEADDDEEATRIKISDFPMPGPQSLGPIADEIGLSHYKTKKLLDHQWFKVEGEGRWTKYANANVKD